MFTVETSLISGDVCFDGCVVVIFRYYCGRAGVRGQEAAAAMTTDISVPRWDPSIGHGQEIIDDFEYDGGNSSSRLFERSRIKALAGKT